MAGRSGRRRVGWRTERSEVNAFVGAAHYHVAGSEIGASPWREDPPDPEFLSWHTDTVFRG